MEEFGVQLVAGGLADQPVGYLNDVMRVRAYARAKDDVESATDTRPPQAWATAMVQPVLERILLGDEEDTDEDGE